MNLEVDKLSATPEPFAHTFTSEELSLDQTEELRLLPGASIAGTASRKGDEVRLRGKISARVESQCDRCAVPVVMPLEVEFDAPYVPAEEQASIEDLELNQPDLDFSVYEGDTIAINDLVREQILLALPSRLVCREDCKGLCPTCGVDLNKETCACGDTEVDPRWAALAALKKK